MKSQPKTLHDAILPIMILNWLTGLSLFENPSRNPRVVLSFVYVILSTSTYYFWAYSYDPTKQIVYGNAIRKHIFNILENANFFISTCCVIIGWYYYKTHKLIIRRIELLDEALETLGFPKNYKEIFINLLMKTVMRIVMIGTVISFDVYFLSQIFDFVKCLHLCYIFHYPFQLHSVADFTFTSTVNYIGLKLDNINLLLERISPMDPKPETVEELYKKHSRISALIMSTESSDILNNTERQKKLIILIKHLHMELAKISFQINKIYQTQMTMIRIVLIACVTGFLYILFSLIIFFDKRFPENSRIILCATGWCAICFYRLLNVNSTCGNVSSKSRRTREILCEMKNTVQNEELKEEIEQFSLQLTQRPLVFTLCGFTTLDYHSVQGFMETLTTYLVLLIHCSPGIKG